jgi:macrolide transport system ATP-binding/permease protein
VKRPIAERLAWLLLWCYPPAFRRQCGEEILQFVRTTRTGGSGSARLLWLVASDGLRSIPREWIAAFEARHVSDVTAQPPGESMRNIIRDFRLAARLLLKSPSFTFAAVLTLALGIGANTAMFTLAEATLLTPVKVRNPERLVVWSWTSAYPDYQEYAKRRDVFEGVAAIGSGGRMNLVIDGASELTRAVFVTGQTLDVLGVSAAHGRTINASDDVANGPIVAVLGHDYWRTRFAGDPAVVGRSFRINGSPVTIVGVLEQGFRGISLGSNPALYLPTGVYNQVQTGFFARVNALTARGFVWLTVIGRLRPDVSIASAAATMTGLYGQLHPPEAGEKTEQLVLTPLPARALGRDAADVKTFVAMLVGVVGLTLLIGCANLANLLLARAAARRRELGVRLAIGATRGRVIQQMLSESVLLAVLGGAAGIGVAWGALRILSSYELPGGVAIENMHLDINRFAILMTFGLSLVTGLLFGAVPAWRASRTDLLGAVLGQARVATTGSRIRSSLLASQVALSLALMAGAGLFVRSLNSAVHAPLGFNVDGVVAASANAGLARYDESRAQALYAEAIERMRALPQVTSAAWATMIPTRGSWVNQTKVDGYEAAPGEDVTVNMSQVGPGYFKTIGARVLRGREFLDTDRAGAPAVGIVNQAMVQKYWPGRDPIGGRFEQFGGWITVVGVVENAVTDSLTGEPAPFAYMAFNQWLSGKRGIALDPAHLLVRTTGHAATAVPLIREQLRSMDPELPLYDVVPFEQHVGSLLMPQRMGVALFTLFGALALTLAATGIYGVATYVATLRTREIGLRVALGASAGAVRRMILLEGARPVIIGIIAGLAFALSASRALQAFLLDVSPLDPVTFVAVTLLLGSVALVASFLPARRAARIEPVNALRHE